jgi:hypothetical protein
MMTMTIVLLTFARMVEDRMNYGGSQATQPAAGRGSLHA